MGLVFFYEQKVQTWRSDEKWRIRGKLCIKRKSRAQTRGSRAQTVKSRAQTMKSGA